MAVNNRTMLCCGQRTVFGIFCPPLLQSDIPQKCPVGLIPGEDGIYLLKFYIIGKATSICQSSPGFSVFGVTTLSEGPVQVQPPGEPQW